MLKYNRESIDENTWHIFASVKTSEAYKTVEMLIFIWLSMDAAQSKQFLFLFLFSLSGIDSTSE